MKDQHHSLPTRQPSAMRPRRHREALVRTDGVWRRRAGAAIPLLLAIATAVALG